MRLSRHLTMLRGGPRQLWEGSTKDVRLQKPGRRQLRAAVRAVTPDVDVLVVGGGHAGETSVGLPSLISCSGHHSFSSPCDLRCTAHETPALTTGCLQAAKQLLQRHEEVLRRCW